jgi:hypothetical protein
VHLFEARDQVHERSVGPASRLDPPSLAVREDQRQVIRGAAAEAARGRLPGAGLDPRERAERVGLAPKPGEQVEPLPARQLHRDDLGEREIGEERRAEERARRSQEQAGGRSPGVPPPGCAGRGQQQGHPEHRNELAGAVLVARQQVASVPHRESPHQQLVNGTGVEEHQRGEDADHRERQQPERRGRLHGTLAAALRSRRSRRRMAPVPESPKKTLSRSATTATTASESGARFSETWPVRQAQR